jgi:FtsH-binding integral membrane protein
MNDQTNESIFPYAGDATRVQPLSKTFMSGVFLWMFVALAISSVTAYLFANSPSLMSYLINEELHKMNTLGWVVMFAPLGFVMLMSYGYNRLSAPAMMAAYIFYAAITGISFSFILMAYTSGSIITCFVSAALMFGVMGALGYTTDKDLTSMGRILSMGVIGIVIAMVVNLFLGSSRLDYIISIIGVIVFTGLAAYDVQKLKRIGAGLDADGNQTEADVKKLSIMGALTLYLDFVNLFLFLLRLFGRRK